MNILVLEDEWLVAEDIRLHLENLGHTVAGPAMTCAAALELMWRERPDLAVLDTQLGSETCEVVLEECQRQDIPVIICSGHSLEYMPTFAQGLPHLPKPFAGTMVAEAIAEVA